MRLACEILSKVVYERKGASEFKVTSSGSLLGLFFTIDEQDAGDDLGNQFEALEPAPMFLGFRP